MLRKDYSKLKDYFMTIQTCPKHFIRYEDTEGACPYCEERHAQYLRYQAAKIELHNFCYDAINRLWRPPTRLNTKPGGAE